MLNALELVKEVYSRFSKSDINGFLALCAYDIEWVVNGPPTLEKCRAFRGIQGVQEFLNILEKSWEFSVLSPREFIADGQTVVVLGEEAGTEKILVLHSAIVGRTCLMYEKGRLYAFASFSATGRAIRNRRP